MLIGTVSNPGEELYNLGRNYIIYAITYFDPKTARGSVDCGKCLRVRFRYMGEVCTLVLFIFM